VTDIALYSSYGQQKKETVNANLLKHVATPQNSPTPLTIAPLPPFSRSIVGIAVARGMTFVEIKKATGDTNIYTNSAGSVFFPSIGARYDHGNLKVPNDTDHCNGAFLFMVSEPDYPDLHFTGSLLDGPSFAKGTVKREQIIARYGEPKTHIQTSPGIIVCTVEDIPYWRCLQSETNFSQRYPSGITNGPLDSEMLYYRGKGLRFWLKDDVVTALCVHEPWTGDAAGRADEVLKTHETKEDPTNAPTLRR